MRGTGIFQTIVRRSAVPRRLQEIGMWSPEFLVNEKGTNPLRLGIGFR